MITILHVDDEKDFSDIVRSFLEGMDGNVEVDHVSTAAEALEIVEKRFYDLIISDYQMPGKNGLDLLKELRLKGNATPFILLTGKRTEEVKLQAFNLGAEYFVQKTGDPATLFPELYQAIVELVINKNMNNSLPLTSRH